MDVNRLPEPYRILPVSIPFAIPGFECNNAPQTLTLAPSQIDCNEWFSVFVDAVHRAIGRSYLPICRLSDGEFRFLLGDQPLGELWPAHKRLAWRVRQFSRHLLIENRFRAGGNDANGRLAYVSGKYSAMEWAAARTHYSQQLISIAHHGVLALHLTYGTPKPFQQNFFPAFGRWIKESGLQLTVKNYVPFYFVYALLRGQHRRKLLGGRRVLVVNGATGRKRTAIEAGLKSEGVASIDWASISAERSLFDAIDVDRWIGNVDVCLVGAGVGKPAVLMQLAPLSVPCIDAGFVMEVWADPRRAAERPFMTPCAE